MSKLIYRIIECGPICGLCVVMFVVLALVAYLVYNFRKDIAISLLLSVTISVFVAYPVYKFLDNKWPGQRKKPSHDQHQYYFVYDTDSKNDVYIKSNLHPQLLRILDRVLEKEKKNSGLRLTDVELNKITSYNNEVNEAYNRWRKCKDMMRSSHHVIYPSERDLYFKTGE